MGWYRSFFFSDPAVGFLSDFWGEDPAFFEFSEGDFVEEQDFIGAIFHWDIGGIFSIEDIGG
jgi:hypothetical protein